MSCFGECLDLGPPPDTILFLPPPPPAPSIQSTLIPELLLNTTPCSTSQICDAWAPSLNKIATSENGDFMELPRKDDANWSSLNDPWLLILIASSIGVLILGALLAMFLLKCREMNFFGSNECSMHSREPSSRPIKIHEQHNHRECSSGNANKIIHPSDPNFYNGNMMLHDNRMVWAALTPGGGTQHFISENYPKDFLDYGQNRDAEDHYETIDSLNIKPAIIPQHYQTYKDYETYEEPIPLIQNNYQPHHTQQHQYNTIHHHHHHHNYNLPNDECNTDMRCLSMAYTNSIRRPHLTISRPKVSSPTRIEHPNLPPLNLYPLKNNTLKRNNNLTYRHVENGTLPKYAC